MMQLQEATTGKRQLVIRRLGLSVIGAFVTTTALYLVAKSTSSAGSIAADDDNTGVLVLSQETTASRISMVAAVRRGRSVTDELVDAGVKQQPQLNVNEYDDDDGDVNISWCSDCRSNETHIAWHNNTSSNEDDDEHCDVTCSWQTLTEAKRMAYSYLSQNVMEFDVPYWQTLGFTDDVYEIDEIDDDIGGLIGPTIDLALRAKRQFATTDALPLHIWQEYVLNYANVNEARNNIRPLLYDRLIVPLVIDYTERHMFDDYYLGPDDHDLTFGRKAELLNRHMWTMLAPLAFKDESDIATMTIRFMAGQTPVILDPMSILTYGFASCTGLAILYVQALRAAGVPARVAGTPAWHGDASIYGNHNWVEIYSKFSDAWHYGDDDDDWTFVEPSPAQGVMIDTIYKNPCDRWFCHQSYLEGGTQFFAAQLTKRQRKSGSGSTFFPLAWESNNTAVPAEDRTAYYLRICGACPGKKRNEDSDSRNRSGQSNRFQSLPSKLAEPARRDGQVKGQAPLTATTDTSDAKVDGQTTTSDNDNDQPDSSNSTAISDDDVCPFVTCRTNHTHVAWRTSNARVGNNHSKRTSTGDDNAYSDDNDPTTSPPAPCPWTCTWQTWDEAKVDAYNFLLHNVMEFDRAFLQTLGFSADNSNLPDGLSNGLIQPAIDLALRAKKEFFNTDVLALEIWQDYVLNYANLNEARNDIRPLLWDRIVKPLIVSYNDNMKNDDDSYPDFDDFDFADKATILNANMWRLLAPASSCGSAKQPNDKDDCSIRFVAGQTPAIFDPMSTLAYGFASCTGLAILYVQALRAAGVPARVAGTPAWHKNADHGNHNWVEIYTPNEYDSNWAFVEPSPGATVDNVDSVNRDPCGRWFCHESYLRNGTQFFAAQLSASSTSTHFPLAWEWDNEDVPAEDRTYYYQRICSKCGGSEGYQARPVKHDRPGDGDKFWMAATDS